ncbi:hypothetical protein FHS19_006286 [Paenibacillus rhizosphaerae]|uniref:Uncharacterized protein n=1 Tax=Paenibacillus rhizosphaerae TaxID=297318 RepID=A0A839TYJ2_9BACL|nr:hypothetical protein [Paenibacillus rhizosphaerae]
MYDHFYTAEYLMKMNEQQVQKTARQAWKWSTEKPKMGRYRFLDSVRKAKTVPCCSQPIQACC